MSQTETDHPTVARYKAVSSDPPPLTEAVAVGDACRAALMSVSDAAPVFAGKDADGEPLDGHRHNHVIPESLSGDGYVSHVTLYAPMGFDESARDALSTLDEVWLNAPVQFDLDLVLLGVGTPGDFGGTNRRAGHSLALAESTVWRSRTPFVPTRHRKERPGERGYEEGGPTDDLLRLLEVARFPRPIRVDGPEKGPLTDDPEARPAGTEFGADDASWEAFRTVRTRGAGRRSTSDGYGFEIEFAKPVQGPVCAGYGAHFGLGRFEPVDVDGEEA